MLLLIATTAMAYDADVLLERVAETQPYRTHRIEGPLPTFSSDDYRKAAQGKVVTGLFRVEGSSNKVGYGVSGLDVGLDQLWAGLNSETQHVDLLPVDYIEIIDGTPCADHRQVLMTASIPLITDRWWITQNTYNTAIHEASAGAMRELGWASPTDFANTALSPAAQTATDGLVAIGFSHGAWFMLALDPSHTLVEYHSWVDPGGRVPASAASMFATAGIEDTFEAMETYSQGSTYCAGRM
jgi:hypothetical protein